MKTVLSPPQNELHHDPLPSPAGEYADSVTETGDEQTSSSPGLSVALLGPDGAGKTELVKRIESRFTMPVRTLYMGLYGKSSPLKLLRRVPVLRFVFMLLWQWLLCAIAAVQRLRGKLVLFDRYTYDALLPAGTPLTARRKLRRWLLARSCPAPDLVILLDAPGEVLFARKGEHNPEHLEAQRQAYRGLADHIRGFRIVDATQEADAVYREVSGLIRNELASRRRQLLRTQSGLQKTSHAGLESLNCLDWPER